MRMRRAVRPTGQEHTFGVNEIIASKTDPKGVITYANDVFLRVSRYPADEVLGAPHSLIRHPEMPGGVFWLLWETISSGREIFAYVDNLAADGSHYWVLAHVTPTINERGEIVGYHSNRRCPDRQPVDQIRPLYQRMLRAEAQHSRKIDAARAGAQVLLDELAELDSTYDRFIWGLINEATPPADTAMRKVHALAGAR